MKQRRLTIRDVAKRAGVSPMTVSRVINDQPGVGETTRAHVQAIVDDIGFRRNALASSMRRGKSLSLLGLLIQDVTSPFYASVASGVTEVALERGYMVVTTHLDEDPDRERAIVDSFLEREVDGLLLFSGLSDHGQLHEVVKRGFPIVFLGRPPINLSTDAVFLENREGGRIAARYLQDRGATDDRTVVIGDGPNIWPTQERIQGFREVLATAGSEPLATIDDARGAADAERRMRELLRRPDAPSAVFATNNRMSVGVLRAVKAEGAELNFVGFDDFEFADLLTPPVTVVCADPREMGLQAAELVFSRLDNPSLPPRQLVLPVALRERSSGSGLR